MDGDGVTYSFKDLFDRFDKSLSEGFARLDRRLDEVNRKLDSKADIRSVVAVESKINELEDRLEGRFEKIDQRFKPLELASAGAQAASKTQQRLTNALVILASGGVGAIVYLLVGGHP